LNYQLPDHPELVERLVQKESTILVLQAERDTVKELFLDKDGDFAFSSPDSREFILRTIANHPLPSSRPLIHRLYAILTGSEFRVGEALCFDTMYY